MDSQYRAEQAYLEAERQEEIAEIRRDPAYSAADEQVLVVGEENPMCHTCHVVFVPQDMASPNGEYLENCEARTKSGGPFPADLPRFAERNPYAFCSEPCEQDAIDLVCVTRIEDERLMQDYIDTPSLEPLGSYAQ